MDIVSEPVTQQEFDKAYGFQVASPESLSTRLAKRAKACCSLHGLLNILYRTVPCIQNMRAYSFRSHFLHDLIAGLTVCAMNIPQGMAYSILAGLPPVYGLYTSLFPVLVYFVFGTSRHISIGVMAIVSIAISSGVARIMQDFPLAPSGSIPGSVVQKPLESSTVNGRPATTPPQSAAGDQLYLLGDQVVSAAQLRLELVMAMSLLTGLILAIAGLLRLGFLTTYLSEAMLNGYTNALSIHVATSQFIHVIGFKPSQRYTGFFKLGYVYADILMNFGRVNVVLLPLSFLCLVTLVVVKERIQPLVSKRVNVQLPIDLLMIIIGTVLGILVDLPSYKISIVGSVPAGMPTPKAPNLTLLPLCFSDSLIIAAISFAQTIALAKTFALRNNYHVRSNQELVAMGLCDVISCFFTSFACAAAVSRTLVQVGAGSYSQMSGLVNCVGVVLILSFVAPLFETLPIFVLASIILVALKSITKQFQALPALFRKSKWDFSMWLVAFVATILMDADYGLIVGFSYSILTILWRVQEPRSHLLGVISGTDEYRAMEHYNAAREIDGLKIFRFNGPLIFASADYFRKSLLAKLANAVNAHYCNDSKVQQSPEGDRNEKETEPTAVLVTTAGFDHLVIDFGAICYADPTGVHSLQQAITECSKKNIKVLLAGANSAVCGEFERSDLFKKFDRNLLFVAVKHAVNYVLQQRAAAAANTDASVNSNGLAAAQSNN